MKACVVVTEAFASSSIPEVFLRQVELVTRLHASGHSVTLLFAGDESKAGLEKKAWLGELHHVSVLWEVLPKPEVVNAQGLLGSVLALPYEVFEHLKHSQFDSIYFSDRYGPGYYCFLAKRQGLYFQNCSLNIAGMLPSAYEIVSKAESIADPRLLIRFHIEQQSVELADRIWLPSNALLSWLDEHGYVIDRSRCSIEWQAVKSECPQSSQSVRIHELVIPDWHMASNGLAMFARALKRIDTALLSTVRIVVLATSRFAGVTSKQALILSKQSGVEISVIEVNSSAAVRTYLSEPGRVPLFLTTGSFPPLLAVERLSTATPVLCIENHAVAELLDEEEANEVMLPANPRHLASELTKKLRDGLSLCHGKIRSNAEELGATSLPMVTDAASSECKTLVTVCVIHHERPHLLQQALRSVVKQTYDNLEIVLVDDGSESEAAISLLEQLEQNFTDRPLRIVRQENKYLGAARNTAARHAEGEYLFFLDDDNVLKEDAIEKLVGVASRNGYSIVGSFSDGFRGDDYPTDKTRRIRITHAGGGLAFNLFRNGMVDSNALIRRDRFLAVGGNTEHYAVGKDDQEFFARAVLAGEALTIVPEALYWARQLPVRLRNLHFSPFAGDFRVAEAYRKYVPVNLYWGMLFAQGCLARISVGRRVLAHNLQPLDGLRARVGKREQLAENTIALFARFGQKSLSLLLVLLAKLRRLSRRLGM